MSALSDLKKGKTYSELSSIERCIVHAGAKLEELYSDEVETVEQAATELSELLAIKEAAWKLIEHPDSEAKLHELARVLGVEL